MRVIQGGDSAGAKVMPFRESVFPTLFYSKAMYDLPVPIVILDVEIGALIEINQAALDILGVSASKIIGRKFKDVFSRAERDVGREPGDSGHAGVHGRYVVKASAGADLPVLVHSATYFTHRKQRFCLVVFRSEAAPADGCDDVFASLVTHVGGKAYDAFKSRCIDSGDAGPDPGGILVLGLECFCQHLELSGQEVRSAVIETLISKVTSELGDTIFINRRRPMELWVRCSQEVASADELEPIIRSLCSPFSVHGLVFEPEIRAGFSARVINHEADFHAVIAEARERLRDAANSGRILEMAGGAPEAGGVQSIVSAGKVDVAGSGELEVYYHPVASLADGRISSYVVGLGYSSDDGRVLQHKESTSGGTVRGEAARLKLLNVLDLLARRHPSSWVFWIDVSVGLLLDEHRFQRLLRLLHLYGESYTRSVGFNLVCDGDVGAPQLRDRLKTLRSLGIQISQDESDWESRGIRPGTISQLDAVHLKFPMDSAFRFDPSQVLRLTELVRGFSKRGIQVFGMSADTDQAASFLSWVGCDRICGEWVGPPVREDALPLDGDELRLPLDELVAQQEIGATARS